MNKTATYLANSALFLGLAVLAATDAWWPGILALLAIYLAVRGLLRNRLRQHVVAIVVLITLFLWQAVPISIDLGRFGLALVFVILALVQLTLFVTSRNK